MSGKLINEFPGKDNGIIFTAWSKKGIKDEVLGMGNKLIHKYKLNYRCRGEKYKENWIILATGQGEVNGNWRYWWESLSVCMCVLLCAQHSRQCLLYIYWKT